MLPILKNSTRHSLALVAALWGSVAVSALAADVKVIANPSVQVSALSAEELKNVFLGTKTSLVDGSHVEPIVLKSGAVHETFVRQFLGKTDTALEIYYRSLVFTGKGLMPRAFSSDAKVVDYVAKTKGAVGYVSATTNVAGVKTLEVK